MAGLSRARLQSPIKGKDWSKGKDKYIDLGSKHPLSAVSAVKVGNEPLLVRITTTATTATGIGGRAGGAGDRDSIALSLCTRRRGLPSLRGPTRHYKKTAAELRKTIRFDSSQLSLRIRLRRRRDGDRDRDCGTVRSGNPAA